MQARSYTSISDVQLPTDLPDQMGNIDAALLPNPAGAHAYAHQVVAVDKLPAIRELPLRRARFALLAARIAADSLLLIGAFLLAYWLRYEAEVGRDVSAPESFLPLSAFYLYTGLYVVGTLFVFRMKGLYALPRGASWLDHMGVVAAGSVIGVSSITLLVLLVNASLPSRLLFIYLWLCTLSVFAMERFIYRRVRIGLWRRGINIRTALVIGTSVAAQRIMKDIIERPEQGYKLLGYVPDTIDVPDSAGWHVPIGKRYRAGLVQLGDLKDTMHIIGRERPDEVIVALPATHHSQTMAILDNCRQFRVQFRLVPDLFEMRFNEVRIDALNGVPLIGVKDLALQGINLLIKRIMDVALVIIALALAALPMLIIAIAVKLTSPGTILFRQKRVGKDGRIFTCYKFRSMYADAEARLEAIRHLNESDGPTFKMKNDPRLTKVGKILRRWSLDELPQLFNILRGDMSWVGPRPPTVDEVEKYSRWHKKRLEVRGGLTGLWQVSGRSDLSFDEMVKLDLYYAENWSLGVDLMILIRTIPAVLKCVGAY